MTGSEHFDKLMENNILKYSNGWLSLNTPSEAPQAASEAPEDDYECICIDCRFARLEAQIEKLSIAVDCLATDVYDAKSGIDRLIKTIFGK